MFNLLLVDDRQDSHLLIKAFLESLTNVHIESAYTAEEAIQKVHNDKFGLVFLDLHLPDGSGYTVLEKIKENFKELPVYILSANAFDEDIQKSRSLGAVDHLSKPIRKKTIVDVVTKYAH